LLETSDHLYDFQNLVDDALEPDPLESWFSAVRHLSLTNQANRLEHVSDVVKTSDLGFKQLLIIDLAVRNLLGCLLEREYFLPCHKESNELLAKVA